VHEFWWVGCMKLNQHILHWIQCTECTLYWMYNVLNVHWSVTCFWYCRRTAEGPLHRLRFWLSLTYLVISRTTLTCISKLKLKWFWKLKKLCQRLGYLAWSAAWADTTNRCKGSTDHAKFSRCALSRSVKISLEIPVSASWSTSPMLRCVELHRQVKQQTWALHIGDY